MLVKQANSLGVKRYSSAIASLIAIGLTISSCTTTSENQAPSTSNAATNLSNSNRSNSNNQQELQTIRIGYVRWGLLPIVRQRQELERQLAKQNISVEWVGPFPAFAPVLEAVNAGEVDISSGGDIPGISGLVGGTPVCILAYQAPIPEAEAVLVRSDAAIQSPKDLVGKKVAVNRGGWGEHLLLRVLDQANVPKEQVERVYLSPTDALPAVTQGHVDAWSVWDPNVAIAETEHNLRPISSGEAASHYGIYIVHQEILAEKPEVVRYVFQVLEQEAKWAAENRVEAAKAFGDATELATPVVNKLATRRLVNEILPLNTQVLSDIQSRADWMYEQKAIPKKLEVNQTICPETVGLEKFTKIQ
jgi:sulfonate transport system substrate-binding protein